MSTKSVTIGLSALLFFLGMMISAAAQQPSSPDVPPEFIQALEHYERFEFEETLELLDGLDFPEAHLFKGKSWFGLGNNREAAEALRLARVQSTPDVYHEAGFTLALVQFNKRSFAESFELLHEIITEGQDGAGEIRSEAESRFEAFSAFLTPSQRLDAVSESSETDVQQKLLIDGVKMYDRETAREMINALAQMQLDSDIIARVRQEFNRRDFSDAETRLVAPEGLIYKIGLLLPQQDRNESAYEVSRSIYYGMLMAIEEFNRGDSGQRISLHVARKSDTNRTVTELMQYLVDEYDVDVILGPLFSEDAKQAAQESKALEVPVIAPLANSDDLANLSPYFFQANPTFRERGKKMADIAINVLGYDSLSVITEMNTMGAQEASAFRDVIRENDGTIVHNFIADFRSMRYDLTNFTQHFAMNRRMAPDTTITITPVDAVFLPLTGGSASTVIDIVLTDLLAFRSPVSIIGTEEWGLTEISSEAINRFNIVYSGIFNRDEGNQDVINFRADYQNQFGSDPDNFAFIGFDNGMLIAETLIKAGNPKKFAETLRKRERFTGINQWFYFNGGQVNKGIQPLLLTQTGPILIRE